MNQDIGISARRGKAPSHRQLRVGEELRHALSRILARGELRDPSLADLNLTVTEVRLSPDLKNATAFVVPSIVGPAAITVTRRTAASDAVASENRSSSLT